MWGKMGEPMTGEEGKKVKRVTRVIDKDRHVFDVFDVVSWSEGEPVMVGTYTRTEW
jgi:peroxiredoxin